GAPPAPDGRSGRRSGPPRWKRPDGRRRFWGPGGASRPSVFASWARVGGAGVQQKPAPINRPALRRNRRARTGGTVMPTSPAKPRTAYLVLGMHRSGTSAVTQLLGLAGAKLPANVMPGDEHNEKGYFEPWKIAIFNDERL